MHEPIEFRAKDVSGSYFREAELSTTTFSDVNLEKTTIENINLRQAIFSAVDFGGTKFECVNTGEYRPKVPVMFEGVEFDDCIFHKCGFLGSQANRLQLKGMTIDGILVTEMIKAYRRTKRDNADSLLGRVLGAWL